MPASCICHVLVVLYVGFHPIAYFCIAYVDNSCVMQTSVRAYCLNFELTEPTPAQGYPYGSVTFERKVGIDNLTINTTIFGSTSTATDAEKELAAERIAFVMCQGVNFGYSLSSINSAIWFFSDTNTSCNGLCNLAITRVPYPVGGISEQIVIYEPSVSTVQPYIETGCYTVNDYADAPSSYGNPYHVIEDECHFAVRVGVEVAHGGEPNILHGAAVERPRVVLLDEVEQVVAPLLVVLHQVRHVVLEKELLRLAVAVGHEEDELRRRKLAGRANISLFAEVAHLENGFRLRRTRAE